MDRSVGRSAGGSVGGSAGRLVGTVAALTATALWLLFLFRNPYAKGSPDDAEMLFGMLFVGASAVAAAAAALGAHLGMYLLFFILFVPVGANTMRSGGMFQAIGWLDLLYLGAAVLVHRAIAKSRTPRAESRTPRA